MCDHKQNLDSILIGQLNLLNIIWKCEEEHKHGQIFKHCSLEVVMLESLKAL